MINYIIIDDTDSKKINKLFIKACKGRKINLLGTFESYTDASDGIEKIFTQQQSIDLAFIDWQITGGEGTDFINKLDKAYNNKTVKIIVSSRIPSEIVKEKLSNNIKIHHLLKGDNKKLAEYFSDILDIHFPIKTETFKFVGNHSNEHSFNTDDVIYYSTLGSFLFLFKNMLTVIKEKFSNIDINQKSSAIDLIYSYINSSLDEQKKRSLSNFKVMILKNYNIYITNANSESPNLEFFTCHSPKFELKQTTTGGDYIINNEYFIFNNFNVLFFKTSSIISLQFIGRNSSDIPNLKIDNIRDTTPII